MKKSIISVAIATSIIVSSLISSNTSNAQTTASSVLLNGKAVPFNGVEPMNLNNRTYVPYRDLLEALGATVSWDQQSQTATATKDGVTIKIPIGSNVITVDGNPLTMDVKSEIIEDRTMVPLRFVAQALGATVQWEQNNNGGQVVMTQSPTDMLNQMITGNSGDQSVTYEQAAVLFDWLNVQKDQLPAFAGLEVPNDSKYKYTVGETAPEGVYENYLYGHGAPEGVMYVEKSFLKTGIYRIEQLEVHNATSSYTSSGDLLNVPGPNVLGVVYVVWDTTHAGRPGWSPWTGTEMASFLPPVGQ